MPETHKIMLVVMKVVDAEMVVAEVVFDGAELRERLTEEGRARPIGS